MIGQEAVRTSLEVHTPSLRDITAASSPTDRLEQARPSPSWEI